MTDETKMMMAAARQLTPEQLDEFKAGRLLLPPKLAEFVCEFHNVTAPPPPVIVVPPKLSTTQTADWLASQDAYDAARDKADAVGASPANLNALLQPDSLKLPCGLTMLPLTLSGYIFLEAVQSPYVMASAEKPTPTDTLLLSLALICPEKAAALLTFGEDFQPSVTSPDELTKLALTYAARVGSEDVPRLMAHATAQFGLMFPQRQGGDGSDPLTRTPAAQAAGG